MDQPTGRHRLIDRLRAGLNDDQFTEFRIMVAFAKLGPLLRLSQDISRWCAAGKRIEAIFGIDEQGTSQEALDFALTNFNKTYIAHVQGNFAATFHPKMYLFKGETHVLAFLGSNNLTVGGIETNFESHVRLELDLPQDEAICNELTDLWNDARNVCTTLTNPFLQQLIGAQLVIGEEQIRRSANRSSTDQSSNVLLVNRPVFPRLSIVPPSALPRDHSSTSGITRPHQSTQQSSVLYAQALVMQIIPHGNGEILLSKRAVDQNPTFFGWPFLGFTTPKKASNPRYPQRLPDPVVQLRVFDATGNCTITHTPFDLNTVYYEKKSELRITVPIDVIQATPDYSILVMQQTSRQGYDYDIDIYAPNSSQYNDLLQRCNNVMPSGGNPTPRRFGWI